MRTYKEIVKNYILIFKEIKAFRAIERVLGIQNHAAASISDKNGDSKGIMFWAQALVSFISGFAFMLILGACVYLAVQGEMTIGEVVAITNTMNFVLSPCQVIANGIIRLRSLDKVKTEIGEFLQIESQEKEKQFLNDRGINRIIFDHATQQISEKFSLANLTFSIEKGKKYAIVGKSGSGKSSLTKLLTEDMDSYEGVVLVNDIPLKKLNKESFGMYCYICHQKPFIFNDTVINNITLWDDYSAEEVQTALQEAHIWNVIQNLPNGIYEAVKENGRNFSGGELQRLALARALLRHPDMLITDEITAGLDNETAYNVEKMLLDKEMTLINITHRYTAELMNRYNEIIVMEQGEIVEQGSFETLMKQQGRFFELFEIEKQKREDK